MALRRSVAPFERGPRTVPTAGHRALAGPPRGRRPLLVTSDGDLLDELLRLAAAAGVELQVAADPAAARGHYAAAPLVLIGSDQARACLRARLPRRTDVVIVSRTEPGSRSDPGPVPPDGAEPDGAELDGAESDGPELDGPELDGPDAWDYAEPLGASQVAALPAAAAWLVDRLAGSGELGRPAPVVAVLGGRGGAGASVLAAGLAWTAAEIGRRVLLVDGDPLGGGIDLMLGWEDDGGVRWPELTGASGRLDAAALLGALPGRGELALVSFDRRELSNAPPEAMAAVLAAGRRVRDLVVVDTPRRLDAAGEVALQTADLGLLVVPAELRAATAAAKVAAVARSHCADLRLVVRGPSPGRLKAEEISRSLGLPLAGTLRPEAGLPATVEGGLPPTGSGRGPLALLCRRLVNELCAPGAAVPA